MTDASREVIAFEFRRRTREPQMREVRDLVGDFGASYTEGLNGRMEYFVNTQHAVTDEQQRNLVAYMVDCGFDLTKARVIRETRTEDDLDVRLFVASPPAAP